MNLAIVLTAILLSGCAHPIYPTTYGGHAAVGVPDRAYVVWSKHPGAGQYVTSILLQAGRPVVERARLQAIFDEQRLTLSHTRDEDVLRVGRLVGASHVIFVEVQGLDSYAYSMLAPDPLRVSVRSVAVESGAVQWSGMAHYNEPASNPESSVINLTYWAMAHGICKGRWEEHTATQTGGCQQVASPAPSASVTTQPAGTEPEIWGEMRRMEKRNKP